MNEAPPSLIKGQLAITIVAVVALCIYALFFQAFEVNNWPGFWFSVVHVVLVGLGTWLALCKVR